MISIFCRIGKKNNLKKLIKSKIPDDYNVYVEPFVGSGVIYLNTDLKGRKAVINDLDKKLIQGWKAVKKGITLPDDFSIEQNINTQTNFINQTHTDNNKIFIRELIRTCATFGVKGFGKIYQPISKNNFKNKIKNAKLQKDLLKNTTILSTDYKNVIKKYDSPKTFFYLDPPYETTKGLYKDEELNYEELNNILRKIKGKFLLSINDSPNIRNIFKGFNISSILVQGQTKGSELGQTKDQIKRKELLIKNY